jgi:hypothetical protein
MEGLKRIVCLYGNKQCPLRNKSRVIETLAQIRCILSFLPRSEKESKVNNLKNPKHFTYDQAA